MIKILKIMNKIKKLMWYSSQLNDSIKNNSRVLKDKSEI